MLLCAGCSKESAKPNVEPPTAEEGKKLLSEAAGADNKYLEVLGATGTQPSEDRLEHIPLTIHFLTLRESKDFRLLARDPARLAEAIMKSKDKGYGSVIQPEYITAYDFKVDGNSGTGSVSLKAEGVYEGKVEFSAKHVDGKWRIEEFRLPTDKVGVRREADGKWKKIKL
jgi:hypothetical protein